MITWAQARRLEGSGVTANAAAPGFVKTDLNQNARGFVPAMINLSAKLLAVSPETGAGTPLWVAAGPELAEQSGKYFDGRKEKDGKYRDAAAVATLEQRCEEMVAG